MRLKVGTSWAKSEGLAGEFQSVRKKRVGNVKEDIPGRMVLRVGLMLEFPPAVALLGRLTAMLVEFPVWLPLRFPLASFSLSAAFSALLSLLDEPV